MKPRAQHKTLFTKALDRQPRYYSNGVVARVGKAQHPRTSIEESYLFIQFPAKMPQRDKIKALRLAERDLAEAPAPISSVRSAKAKAINAELKAKLDTLLRSPVLPEAESKVERLRLISLPGLSLDELQIKLNALDGGPSISKSEYLKLRAEAQRLISRETQVRDEQTLAEVKRDGEKKRGNPSKPRKPFTAKEDRRIRALRRKRLSARVIAERIWGRGKTEDDYLEHTERYEQRISRFLRHEGLSRLK